MFDLGSGSKREREKRRQMSAADAWIAATALVLSAPLVTNNAKDYCHLGGLQLVSAVG
jgi:predicted nucleic acid-binding protein